MAEQTQNFNLTKDAGTDYYNIDTANANLDKIDKELKNLNDDKANKSEIPKSLPANGGDANTVNGHTVNADVPAGAKFTDTITTINGKTGAIAKADITALGIPGQDTIYTHPSSHPASMITQDASHRFVTDTEKGTWNGKAAGSHTHPASQVAAGTLPAGVLATNSTDYTTSRLRNIRFGTTVPSSLANGEVYMMYE